MTAKLGANVAVTHAVTSTWGTAAAPTTGDRLVADSVAHSRNPERLSETGIGSGADMPADLQQGAIDPKITIQGTGYFNDAKLRACAIFFQGTSVTGNATSGYTHSMVHGGFANVNNKYLTTNITYAANSVAEMASAAVTRFQRTYDNPPNYSKTQYELLGNEILYTGSTNSYATVEAATVANTNKIFAKNASTVTISGLTVPVLSVDINLQKSHSSTREMKGSAGNSAPIITGESPFTGTVTVTLKDVADHTYFSSAAADSVFTMKVNTTGSTVGTVGTYTEEWRFPALKLIDHPSADINSASSNPLSLTFEVFYYSQSVPSGMYSLYPHCIVTNDRSTSYLV